MAEMADLKQKPTEAKKSPAKTPKAGDAAPGFSLQDQDGATRWTYAVGLDGRFRLQLNEVAIGASYPKVAFEIVRLRLTHAREFEAIARGNHIGCGGELHRGGDLCGRC